jgi:hypothetical protein
MVKGVSKQVIVVHSLDPKLFEQAIFILKENAVGEGITDEALLREAKKVMREERGAFEKSYGFLWALGGACLTGLVWMITTFF